MCTRARDVALVPLGALADVDEDRVPGVQPLARGRRVGLVDLGANLGEKVPVGSHYYTEYSEGLRADVATLDPSCLLARA